MKVTVLPLLSCLTILTSFFCLARVGKSEIATRVPVAHGREEYVAGKPFDVGDQWIFLGDEDFVEDKIGVTRAMGNATKLSVNPVVSADLPWEDYVSMPSVIFDDKAGIYHM